VSDTLSDDHPPTVTCSRCSAPLGDGSFDDLCAACLPRCRMCGCTDAVGCPGGCSWTEDDLCSLCVGVAAAVVDRAVEEIEEGDWLNVPDHGWLAVTGQNQVEVPGGGWAVRFELDMHGITVTSPAYAAMSSVSVLPAKAAAASAWEPNG
jgi:hypothetical protein